MKKKFLSVALCFCLLLTLLPTVALADGGNEQMSYSTAILHDKSGVYQDDELYDAGSYQLTMSMETGGYSISATNLKRHQNDQGMGYWAGVAVAAPANATQMKTAMSTTAAPSLEGVSATALEKDVFIDEEGTAYDGATFCADTAAVTTLYCVVQWLDANGKVVTATNETGTDEVYSFPVNFSGVTRYEGTAVAQVGDVSYDTLEKALTAANGMTGGATVVLLQDANLETALNSGVTLSVSKDITLTIDEANLNTLKASQGKIRVNAGSAVDVGGEKMIGDSDANINLAGGYIDVSADSQTLMLEFAGATAEVPEGHRWTLSKSVEQDIIPINVSMDKNSTLTVNSTGEDDGFNVANSAVLTNMGKIVVKGVMSISSAGAVNGNGTIDVASGGVLEVNTSQDNGAVGTLTNHVTNSGTFIWNGDAVTTLSGTITMASGGKVYSQADIANNLGGSKRVLSDKTYAGTEYAYAWEYSVSSSADSDSYAVTVSSATNGKVTVSSTEAAKDAEVTITVTPDEGYVLDTLTVKDASGKAIDVTESGGKYIFKMPDSAVTVSATFKAESGFPSFTDVDTGDWFYKAVQYAYENGMMNGVGNNLFEPGSNLTRGMIAQVLYNLEGTPAAGSGAFTDVADGQWYADAVNWAAANDIVGGYGDGMFGPEDDITREQMAQILYNYAAFKDYDESAEGDLSAFTDGVKTSDWALSAMQWAVGAELLQGYNGELNPTGTATRAEVAQILMSFCENIAK